MKTGTKHKNYPETAAPMKDKAPKIHYATVTIEKPIGDYKFGDVFTATCKLRVMNVEHGKSYTGADPKHRCTLEIMSIDPVKAMRKGLPHS